MRPIWDVNGYYASLGVDVRASKTEIRKAYMATNGHSNEYLTFVVKQLLNPDIRRAYDACSYGSVFMDPYRKQQLRNSFLSRKRQASPLDLIASTDEDGAVPNDGEFLSHPLSTLSRWGFSYYVWGGVEPDELALMKWQGALVSVLGGRRLNCRIAVGVMEDRTHPWYVCTVGYRIVVFLAHDEQPSIANAQAAATQVHFFQERDK